MGSEGRSLHRARITHTKLRQRKTNTVLPARKEFHQLNHSHLGGTKPSGTKHPLHLVHHVQHQMKWTWHPSSLYLINESPLHLLLHRLLRPVALLLHTLSNGRCELAGHRTRVKMDLPRHRARLVRRERLEEALRVGMVGGQYELCQYVQSRIKRSFYWNVYGCSTLTGLQRKAFGVCPRRLRSERVSSSASMRFDVQSLPMEGVFPPNVDTARHFSDGEEGISI